MKEYIKAKNDPISNKFKIKEIFSTGSSLLRAKAPSPPTKLKTKAITSKI